ncbi:hypothetical protein DDN55_15365 [Vibrio cholerae]|nr:hypothetical protein [Vibrio cholerae]EGR4205453.1 hypothetical protein [Vibrio cholerae]EGR4210358.1 hypothetical protein [Vibrio cholerae]RBM33830.1 hypothetical protein DLR58_10960 [Vibrio tarriae]
MFQVNHATTVETYLSENIQPKDIFYSMKNIVLFDYQTVGQELFLCVPWVMNRAVGKVAATADY